jgi:hypothetical protein
VLRETLHQLVGRKFSSMMCERASRLICDGEGCTDVARQLPVKEETGREMR